MPATMMHLYAAKKLLPGGSDAFFLGCILPDAIDTDRAWKDHLHFRDIPAEERVPAMIAFAKSTLTLTRDFDFGVLWHFYLDYLWDIGPQQRHRDTYTGTQWFLDYRAEIAKAGSALARENAWAKPLWQRLKDPDPALYQNSIGMPENEIRHFLDYNFHWHTEKKLGPSEIFDPALVEGFTNRAVSEFKAFLKTYFSEALRIYFHNEIQ